jgi:hypothetical protein
MAMQLTSTAFKAGEDIPARYTCDRENVSPPLTWAGAPPETKSFVLIADDPDAPDPKAPRTVWLHWIVYNLPASVTSLPEAVAPLPGGAREGVNDFRQVGYGGPCPPIGRHRYFFKLYALNAMLPDLGRATRAQVERAMTGHVLAEAQLMGGYQKRH